MAYERTKDTKVVGDSLDAFVQNISNTYTTQVKARNAKDELNFNTAVLEDNLSLDSQLQYRQSQLADVSDDPAEKSRIKLEISNLKDRIEQKKFSDAYLDAITKFQSGASSIDSLISFLNDQKSANTDQTILDTINQKLSDAQNTKFQLNQDFYKNQTQFALNDKSDTVLNTQIDRVSSLKSAALLSGNDDQVSVYDLQLQALKKAQTENSITSDLRNIAVATSSGHSNAIALLDDFNNKIATSSPDSPITIGDTTYASAKEFWTSQRDKYVADQSPTTGFFGRLADETDSKIKTANSQNSLTSDSLLNSVSDYNALSGRPELAGYAANIASGKVAALQSGADLISNAVLNKYSTDYNYPQAITTLTTLKNLGVNVDSSLAKVTTSNASIKQGGIQSTIEEAYQLMTENPGLTIDQAVAQAVKSGQGTVLSPNDVSNKPVNQIATETIKTADQNKGADNPNLTLPNPSASVPPATQTTPDNSVRTITVKAGETLSSIAQRELGSASKYTDIASLNSLADPNKIQAGQVLKLPGVGTSQTAPTVPNQAQSNPAPTPTPTPTPSPTINPPAQNSTLPSSSPSPAAPKYYIESTTGKQYSADQVKAGTFANNTFFIESGTGRQLSKNQI